MRNLSNRTQALVSQQLIVDALLKLMECWPFSNITVSQICQEAKVARQTFYRHYQDKFEVIEQHLFRLALKYKEINTPSVSDIVGNLTTMYLKPPFPRELLVMLKKHDLFHLIEQCCLEVAPLILPETRLEPLLASEKYDRYHIGFVAATVTCVLRLWVEGGFAETPEELAALSFAFFSGTAVLTQ